MGDGDFVAKILTPVADPAGTAADAAAFASRRRWFRLFLIGGLMSGAALALGVFSPAFGYLILDPLTRHTWVLLVTGLALLLVATILMPLKPGKRDVLRVVVVIGLGVVLAVVALLSAFLVLTVVLTPQGPSRFESPDGRSVVVASEGNGGDWNVTVQQSSPVLARTWELACLNGDDSGNVVPAIHWVTPTLIEAEGYSGRTYEFTINPSDSQPTSTISMDCLP